MLVNEYLEKNDEIALQQIKLWLNKWQANHLNLLRTMYLSPVIREIEPLSENLKNLSEVGLEALQLIKQGEKAPVKWLDKANVMIEEAKKPYGQVELRIVDSIEKLVEKSKS